MKIIHLKGKSKLLMEWGGFLGGRKGCLKARSYFELHVFLTREYG